MNKSALTFKRLKGRGFVGWVSFRDLARDPHRVSTSGGVYVVARADSDPTFLTDSPGGHFKGRNPSVALSALEANWVTGAEVVYIGKANQLRRRLVQYARFGEGEPIGHWGGRLIWQLADSSALLVAWKETPGEVPRDVEVEMIESFREAFGKAPFANEPHRLGR